MRGWDGTTCPRTRLLAGAPQTTRTHMVDPCQARLTLWPRDAAGAGPATRQGLWDVARAPDIALVMLLANSGGAGANDGASRGASRDCGNGDGNGSSGSGGRKVVVAMANGAGVAVLAAAPAVAAVAAAVLLLRCDSCPSLLLVLAHDLLQ